MEPVPIRRRDPVEPTVEATARELARGRLDVGSWCLDDLLALPSTAIRALANLLERHRTLSADFRELSRALRDAEAELDREVRREWLSCLHGEIQSPVGRRRCEAAHAEVERLERDLVFVRASIRGTAEDVAELLRPGRGSRASA